MQNVGTVFCRKQQKLCCLHAHVMKNTVDLCTEKKKNVQTSKRNISNLIEILVLKKSFYFFFFFFNSARLSELFQ